MGEHFALERDHLAPLPAEPFDAVTLLRCRVDAKARICVRQAYYSVPARLAGRMVSVRLHAAVVEATDGGVVVARHDRAHRKGEEWLVLDHYLEVLERTPGALPGATALAQARASGAFTAAHEAFWAAGRRRRGDPPRHAGAHRGSARPPHPARCVCGPGPRAGSGVGGDRRPKR